MVTLWGRQWTRDELLARVGRLEQVAGIRLVEGADGAERGVRLLQCSTGASFGFEILVTDITWRQLGTVAYVVAMEPGTNRELAGAPAST